MSVRITWPDLEEVKTVEDLEVGDWFILGYLKTDSAFDEETSIMIKTGFNRAFDVDNNKRVDLEEYSGQPVSLISAHISVRVI